MNKRITIASRQPGFAWAGRPWNTEPVVVEVVEDDEVVEDEDDHQVRISEAQLAELKRQCKYPMYPLRIGAVDASVEQSAAAQRDLADVQAKITAERKTLDELKAERTKVDKALASARKRVKEAERKLEETEAQLLAASVRVTAAESKQTEIQVERKPDPNRRKD